MPLNAGYSKTLGYIPATGPAVLADLKERYKSETKANVDVESGPAADTLRTVAGLFTDSWQDAQGVYNSKHVTAAPGTGGVAEGSSLELLLRPKIGPKQVAQASTVVLPCSAVPGPAVNLPAGQTVRIVGETGTWALVAPIVIPGGGSLDGTFAYFEDGPKQAIPALTWEPVNPVTGWGGAGPNAAAAIPGRLVETDAQYRERYRLSLLDEIYDAVARVQGVTQVSVIEDLDAHTIEALVSGGDPTEVATAINVRAKGVATVGNTLVNIANLNYIGGVVPIRYSIPVLVQTFAAVTVTQGQGYPASMAAEDIAAREKAIKNAVVAHFETLAAGGSTSSFKVASAIEDNAGIAGMDDIDVLLGVVFPPTIDGTLTPAIREQLTAALVDVTVAGA